MLYRGADLPIPSALVPPVHELWIPMVHDIEIAEIGIGQRAALSVRGSGCQVAVRDEIAVEVRPLAERGIRRRPDRRDRRTEPGPLAGEIAAHADFEGRAAGAKHVKRRAEPGR